MKKTLARLLTLSLSLALLLSMSVIPASAAFSDVSDTAWYKDAADYAAQHEMFYDLDDTFRPTDIATRGLFVYALGKVVGADTSTATAVFTDVPADAAYAAAVNWAAANEYVNGVGDNKFAPDAPVTREQIAKILACYFTKNNIALEKSETAPASFADADKIADWAKEYVDYIRSVGIMTGDTLGNFNPQSNLNRAEAATVFMRLDKVFNPADENNDGTGAGTSPDASTAEPNAPMELKYNGERYDADPHAPNGVTSGVAMSEIDSFLDFTSPEVNVTTNDEGLIAAGTTYLDMVDNKTVEAARYIQINDDIVGTLRSTYVVLNEGRSFRRDIEIAFEMYVGETVSFDCRDFGVTPENSEWLDFGRGNFAVTIHNGVVTLKALKPTYNAEPACLDTDDAFATLRVNTYASRPSDTLNFSIDTEFDRTYYVSKTSGESWTVGKGEPFDKTTANHSKNADVIDSIYIYPTASMNIPASKLTPKGYIDPEYVSEYFVFINEGKNAQLKANPGDRIYPVVISVQGGISFRDFDSIGDGITSTILVKSLKDGSTAAIDIGVKCAE